MTATLIAVMPIVPDETAPNDIIFPGTVFSTDDANGADLLVNGVAATSAAQATSNAALFPIDTSRGPA